MSEMSDETPPPGRPVELVPAPAGLWWVILGGCTAVLAPMFGFLAGTILNDNRVDHGAFPPLYLGLFLGFIIGGLGLLAAMYGGWKLYRTRRTRLDAEAPPLVEGNVGDVAPFGSGDS